MLILLQPAALNVWVSSTYGSVRNWRTIHPAKKQEKNPLIAHCLLRTNSQENINIIIFFFTIPTVVTWNLIHAGSIWINHAHVTRYGFQSSNILLLLIIITIMKFLYPTWTTSECVRLKSCWSVWNGLSRLNPGVLPLVINRSIKNIHSVATSISQDVNPAGASPAWKQQVSEATWRICGGVHQNRN